MKRQIFWIAELFIWLLILFLVSGGIMLAKYNYKRQFNTYQIFLPDVDGLISGSPVRFMGINVGYVSQIDIVGEDVYVKFRLTEKGVQIPQGSIATVEFSGLGGSKSLEIYPPKNQNQIISDKFIIPQSPKRIHDSLGVLMDMFDNMAEIAYRVSSFMDKVGLINDKAAVENNREDQIVAQKILDNSNDWIDRAKKVCDNFNKKLKTLKEKKYGDKNND